MAFIRRLAKEQPENQEDETGGMPNLPINASDGDINDTLTYSAVGLPTGLEIGPQTGLITGMIESGAALQSPWTVTVYVTDGVATTDRTFTWTVNQRWNLEIAGIQIDPGPTITDGRGQFTVYEGQTLTLTALTLPDPRPVGSTFRWEVLTEENGWQPTRANANALDPFGQQIQVTVHSGIASGHTDYEIRVRGYLNGAFMDSFEFIMRVYNDAVPVNFSYAGGSASMSTMSLDTHYGWASSTGDKNDLTGKVRKKISFSENLPNGHLEGSGSNRFYVPDDPFKPDHFTFETDYLTPGAFGNALRLQQSVLGSPVGGATTRSSYTAMLQHAWITSTEYYVYQPEPNTAFDDQIALSGPSTVTREIYLDPNDGKWYFQLAKEDDLMPGGSLYKQGVITGN